MIEVARGRQNSHFSGHQDLSQTLAKTRNQTIFIKCQARARQKYKVRFQFFFQSDIGKVNDWKLGREMIDLYALKYGREIRRNLILTRFLASQSCRSLFRLKNEKSFSTNLFEIKCFRKLKVLCKSIVFNGFFQL